MYSLHSVIEHIYWPSPLCYSASADMRDIANATETPKAAQRHNPFDCDVGYLCVEPPPHAVTNVTRHPPILILHPIFESPVVLPCIAK